MQLRMYFFVPFVRPCTQHDYGELQKVHARKDCVWSIILDAEIYTTRPGERVLVVMTIGVRECIFLGMQKIFAQIWSCISQVTYKQQDLMLRLKRSIVNKSRCLHAYYQLPGFEAVRPQLAIKFLHSHK